MRKRRKNNRKSKIIIERRQVLKWAAAVFLVVITVTLGFSMCQRSDGSEMSGEVRGVWISYVDFGKIGLTDSTEAEFRENVETFFSKAEELHINTIYFHTRVFRDAVYKSDYFPMSKTIWTGSDEIPYDSLEIMIEIAHEHDMELHAWLNPYRNTSFDEQILDPAKESTTEEILLCVNEIIENYDVDGIHFDDYFYTEESSLTNTEKMANVNKMVKAVYKAVHKADDDLVFGISPAGNISYSESLGADVSTWLSQSGYVDYIMPQIYWTDEHTATWRDNMFSDTMNEWMSMNESGIPIYAGLALYRAGTDAQDDPGWKNSSENIAWQITQLREAGYAGYAFFSASDFFREGAEEELKNYTNLVF